MIWSIILAAGQGRRFGQLIPKQYAELGGSTVLDRSLATAGAVCDGVVLVVDAAHRAAMEERIGRDHVRAVRTGGATRSESVRSGLDAVPADATIVLVHDAARPLASAELYRRVIRAVRGGADGAVPGLPVVDTLKTVFAGRVAGTVDRADKVAVQTPQGFSARALRSAHATGADATDDAGLVESDGGEVVVVDGEPDNLKITVESDLALAEFFLSRRHAPRGLRLADRPDVPHPGSAP